MRRFRIITAACLTAITLMVAANAWYLYSLYNSIKEQTLQTVTECVRRADMLEILSRIGGRTHGQDESFIRMSFHIVGNKTPDGRYEYPDLLENIGQTMSEYFHSVEASDSLLPTRDYAMLDSIFHKELYNSGLDPEIATIRPLRDNIGPQQELWNVDFAISADDEPIYTAYFSNLNSHILKRMSGIVTTSGIILCLMAFLIWYLLHWVRRLRSIEQMKDDFTHNMTHELKTPVAVAYSAADSMLRYYDQSDEKRNRQFLAIIMERLSFLSGMIENILSMSMQRFKTMRLDIEPVALRPLVTEIAGMMELKATKPVTFTVDIPDGLSVRADSLHLGNVLSNIIDNAMKYSGSEVAIRITADSGSITVADNGIGIDKAHLPYIFDKFYRVTSGDRYEVGGYGLGLYYVRQITELHGWGISVTSKPGQGTTFTIKTSTDEKK